MSVCVCVNGSLISSFIYFVSQSVGRSVSQLVSQPTMQAASQSRRQSVSQPVSLLIGRELALKTNTDNKALLFCEGDLIVTGRRQTQSVWRD